jgi:hypothetical protein
MNVIGDENAASFSRTRLQQELSYPQTAGFTSGDQNE